MAKVRDAVVVITGASTIVWRPMAEGTGVSGGWTGHEGKPRRSRALPGTSAVALGLGWLGLHEAREHA